MVTAPSPSVYALSSTPDTVGASFTSAVKLTSLITLTLGAVPSWTIHVTTLVVVSGSLVLVFS